jgi:hypothetical protein
MRGPYALKRNEHSSAAHLAPGANGESAEHGLSVRPKTYGFVLSQEQIYGPGVLPSSNQQIKIAAYCGRYRAAYQFAPEGVHYLAGLAADILPILMLPLGEPDRSEHGFILVHEEVYAIQRHPTNQEQFAIDAYFVFYVEVFGFCPVGVHFIPGLAMDLTPVCLSVLDPEAAEQALKGVPPSTARSFERPSLLM